ncbi:MAG: HNH endonuclease [Gemmataceae bacterium]
MSDKKCERCSAPLQGRQAKYCSHYCKKHVRVQCPGCKKFHYKSSTNSTDFCRGCVQTGERNNQWRGGHKYWQEGKLGRDKEGLSWKTQRLLAWERDKYTCQDCGKTREELGYKPHVDHETPYRLSQSHALENLKCRCRSCHKRAEAKRTEL